MTAEHVVIASGGYQVPIIPRFAERLPEGILQMHSQDYKNADQLPPGGVLVVGSGQSGAQLAEDLHLAGRRVHLCLGDAPRVARFYRGADVVKWLHDIGYYETTADERSTSDGERARANHYVTGRDGGRDIDLRRFAVEGMRLYGTLEDYVGGELRFTANLGETLDMADAVSEGIKDSIDAHIAKNGIDAPVEERYTPVWSPSTSPPRWTWRRPASPASCGRSASGPTTAGSAPRSSTAAGGRCTGGASRPTPVSTSSACPGSGPGAPRASPAWLVTPSTSSTSSKAAARRRTRAPSAS